MIPNAHCSELETSVPKLKKTLQATPKNHPPEFSTPWKMQQTWLLEAQEGLRTGTVSMAWKADALLVFAMLPDDEVFSSSTADGQKLWTLGDVFEMFIRRENSPVYLELHVSPNAHQLHLRWTVEGFEKIRNKQAKLKDFMAEPRAFTAEVFQLPNQQAWAVFARIPASILPDGRPFVEGEKLLVSFSRYDTDGKGNNAVLSSTSPHEKLSFHRQQEWRRVILD